MERVAASSRTLGRVLAEMGIETAGCFELRADTHWVTMAPVLLSVRKLIVCFDGFH